MNKDNALVYFCVAIFGILGVYFTFFDGNISNYDSQTKAYEIYPNKSYDSDDVITYQPIYYFKVNDINYECRTKGSSSSYPSESKNTVYYDSSNPTNCKTEYEKSTGRVAGIICLIATAIIIYFFIIKKPSNNLEESDERHEVDIEKKYQFEQENAEKVIETIGKVQLIYKRVIIGIIIAILLFFILIDTMIVKQTIVSRDYPETVATFVDRKTDGESTVFDDYIYTFTDRYGKKQEIIVSISKNDTPKQEIKLKYNENDPQDYYEEGSTMDKLGIIWYIVKIIALILLILLFCNKKLLSRVSISESRN